MMTGSGQGLNQPSGPSGVGGAGNIELPIFDWLLLNGAFADTLNGGRISTSNLPVIAQAPAIQFKVDLFDLKITSNLLIAVICGHSTINQDLDIDFEYVVVNPGENFNTKAMEAVLNLTPTTPNIAYNRFVMLFTVPVDQLVANGSFEGRIIRNIGGETGDLHIWQIRAYQVG